MANAVFVRAIGEPEALAVEGRAATGKVLLAP
jgi:hypothetical protein